MAVQVKGPNGVVLTFPNRVAEALLRHDDFERVERQAKPEATKKPESKPAPKRK